MDAVSVAHLSKIYPGGTEALADVSFKISRGRVFCLLGRTAPEKQRYCEFSPHNYVRPPGLQLFSDMM